MNYYEESLRKHRELKGKLDIVSKIKVNDKYSLSIAYTPGVAEPCRAIQRDKEEARQLTIKNNTVAIISNGTAVLGLGNIGALASLPVMEGKAVLMKELGGVNAFPLVIEEQDPEKLVETIRKVYQQFAAINLEDIKAPDCFYVEEQLQELDIPVFHDDQHGTAIVVLGALINSLRIVNKTKEEVKVVINGAGAAGIAIAKLLLSYGIKDLTVLDSKGIISKDRTDLNKYKKEIAIATNKEAGLLRDALRNADVFIGVSKGNILKAEDILLMNNNAIILSMANPTPELVIEEAVKVMNKEYRESYLEELEKTSKELVEKLRDKELIGEKIAIYATGRSDLLNQVNNALVFPGLFRGLIESNAKRINKELFIKIANDLASFQEAKPTKILPDLFNKDLHSYIAKKVIEFYKEKE